MKWSWKLGEVAGMRWGWLEREPSFITKREAKRPGQRKSA